MSLAILFHFLCTQRVSDINIPIIRSLRLYFWITTSVVLFANIKQKTWTVGPFQQRSSINFGQICDFSFSKETVASYWRRGDLPWI